MSDEFESLTPNVIQVKWRTPTEFPLCPQEHNEKPLEEYKKRLSIGQVFCRNQYQDSIILDYALADNGSTLYVMCKSSEKDAVKPWSLAKVLFKDGAYYHEGQTFFQENGAKKYFTLAKGEEWTGGDVFDDFC